MYVLAGANQYFSQILDDYHAQIQHLQKELALVKKEFDEAQKLKGN